MAKVRVYELAKELGLESKELLAKLVEVGEFVRSASSTVEAPVVRKLMDKFPDLMPAEAAPKVKKAPVKKAAAKKKVVKKKAAAKKTAAAKTPRKAAVGNLTPSADLAAVIGTDKVARTEVVKKLWDYIKAQGLQDPTNKRAINADAKLKPVFGKDQITMFELAGLIGKHLS